jgi:hypothetical protein
MAPNATVVIPIRLAAREVTTISLWLNVNRFRLNVDRGWPIIAGLRSESSA